MVSNSISRDVMDSPSDGDRHYIDIASQGNTSLAGAVMRETHRLWVKLPPGYRPGDQQQASITSPHSGGYLPSGQCKADLRSSVRSLSDRNR